MTATLRTVLIWVLVIATSPAPAAQSDWAAAESSRMRLLVAGARDGSLSGGVEILLEPGWHTYWRHPGDAGVPPSFDFSASENVRHVEVLYPAPERYDDGRSVSLVYQDEVVFPITITPVDSGQPVQLELSASFGVCREICIPTGARTALGVPPSLGRDPLAEARLALYGQRIPSPPQPGRFDVERAALDGEALLIDVRAPDSGYLDLFTEPPEGWYLGQASLVSRSDGISRYRLPLEGKPRDAEVLGQSFRFVAVAGSAAIEKTVEIR